MPVISVRVDDDIEERLELLMSLNKSADKSTLIRQMLSKSLDEEIIDKLCDQVRRGNISAWKAARTINVSLYRMLEELNQRGIQIYDENSFESDLDHLRNKYASDS